MSKPEPNPVDLVCDAMAKKAGKTIGGQTLLAKGLRIHRSAISLWRVNRRIPAERVPAIEELTGVPREKQRPDLYRQRRAPKKRAA